ncbi:DUF4194 domain-containing protein [Kineosporia rhizophila]|uniref:DUF4194 domain-containing protein n=1 Tax=Kineosporia rhizophila TaxID=84633 RepID=UPI001E3BE253|nr:DUF4194 domain-containing protein [Kineosporia rhizophila]
MSTSPVPRSELNLPLAVTSLMKGVVYEDLHPQVWRHLVPLQAQIRDHVAVIGLTLAIDPSEGYAFLRQLPDDENAEGAAVPRLIPRRQLTFHQSILLALLRKRLAESDAADGDTRCVLTREQILEMITLFLPAGSTEARMTDQVDALIGKVVELGFLRRLKEQDDSYEIRRILKAFVDAQWLAGVQEGLQRYAAELGIPTAQGETHG